MTRTPFVLLAGLGLATPLGGCGQPLHMQYDHSRSYMEAMAIQADRGRPSVANSEYSLTGFEGILLRYNVTVESTDVESGEVDLVGEFAEE